MTATEMKAVWEAKRETVQKLAAETILENKTDIIGLVIHQQYDEGVDSLGNPLRSYFPSYQHSKQLAGIYRGHTDFNLTGEYHATLDLAIAGDTFVIDSPAQTDKGELKSEWLEAWQGAPINDLTPENIQVAADLLNPLFKEKLEADWD